MLERLKPFGRAALLVLLILFFGLLPLAPLILGYFIPPPYPHP